MSSRWLEFTRSQRIGLVVMLGVVVLVCALSALFSYSKPRVAIETMDSIRFVERVNAFKNQLSFVEYDTYPKYAPPSAEPVSTFEFDPNVADSLTLRLLGIKPFIIRNIQRYMAKGGRFREPADFKRLYGLDSLTFLRLEPFLCFDSQPIDTLPIPRFISVELNGADTLLLQSIKGIGPYSARAIVAYRGRLGGFVSLNQLREISGLQEELHDRVEDMFHLNTDSIRKIAINRASVERLRAHPYINFYQARELYEFRRMHGQFDSLPQLLLSKEFDEEWLARVEPYLDFTKFTYRNK